METRRRDKSLRKQLSISWWPQGQPQRFVLLPREAEVGEEDGGGGNCGGGAHP